MTLLFSVPRSSASSVSINGTTTYFDAVSQLIKSVVIQGIDAFTVHLMYSGLHFRALAKPLQARCRGPEGILMGMMLRRCHLTDVAINRSAQVAY